MPRLALAIAYDGRRFESYARQPGKRTVEGELLGLLAGTGAIRDARSARFGSGSRTDRGVSAAWNVVAFDSGVDPGQVVAATTRAPEGLHLLSASRAADRFEPRRARRRVYRYQLDRPWDWARLRPLARRFLGRRDFSNFRKEDEGVPPMATLTRIGYRASPPGPYLELEAPSFLWHQVRRIVGALEGVQSGRHRGQAVIAALEEPGRRVDLGLAAPENLLLLRVDYDDVVFPPTPRVARARIEEELAASLFRRGWLMATRGNLPTTRR